MEKLKGVDYLAMMGVRAVRIGQAHTAGGNARITFGVEDRQRESRHNFGKNASAKRRALMKNLAESADETAENLKVY